MTLCETCNEPLKEIPDTTWSTLVGYRSPPGHNHNDNCITTKYTCKNGHEVKLSRINTCPACDWTGMDECFCCTKVKDLPNA
jgi:hypothetical protein